jgi:hypothetical protein
MTIYSTTTRGTGSFNSSGLTFDKIVGHGVEASWSARR